MRAGRAAAELTAVFLDRDGVINRKAPEGEYVTAWSAFEFLPGALDALARLAAQPWLIIVATNQRGVARGRMTQAELERLHAQMTAEVTRGGGRIDAIYYCPHEVGCDCRKPETGLFEAAARDFELDLATTAVVGDSPVDIEAARRIGAVAVRVGGASDPTADQVVSDLGRAVDWLIGQSG